MRHLLIIAGIAVVFFFSGFKASNNLTYNNPGLNEGEKTGLIRMREEEKLALDVYTYLNNKWDHPVFKNILQAETRHGQFVKELLDKYQLEDPYISEQGRFASTEMQNLYNEFTAKGSQSLLEAFTVGAIIEDMDIADLDQLIAKTSNKEILDVYENLNLGSRNHLRAFSRQLEMQDAIYNPTYISKDRYIAIINGNHEKGNCNNTGSKCNKEGKKSCNSKGNKSCSGQASTKACAGGKTSCKSEKGSGKCCSK